MARTDTLDNYLTDIAEVIKEELDTDETIPANEFDNEIRNIARNVPTSLSQFTNDLFIEAENEEEALRLSKENPGKFYFWADDSGE